MTRSKFKHVAKHVVIYCLMVALFIAYTVFVFGVGGSTGALFVLDVVSMISGMFTLLMYPIWFLLDWFAYAYEHDANKLVTRSAEI